MPWRELKGLSRFHIAPHLAPGLGLLYSNRLILQFGSGLLGLFFPIFMYEQFSYSPNVLFAYFFATFFVSFFMLAPGAMVMSRVGLKLSMIIAVIALAVWYLLFAYFDPAHAFIYLAVAVVFHNIWRMFYWTPFHTEFAELTKKGERGRTVGFLYSIASLMSIAIPFLAGIILARFGFDALFLAAAVIIFASIFPLIFTPRVIEKYSFGYIETFKKMLDKEHRRMVIAYTADGAEATVGAIIWPIFIYEILQGNYFEVGALSSMIILIGVIIRLIVGNWSDKFSKHKLLKWGSGIYAIGWIAKMFVDTAFTIFIASTFHNFALIVMRTPFDVIMYERAADAGHYVDEYTVIREMAICLGRLIMIALLFATLLFVPLYLVFVFAAIAALLMNKID